MSEATERSIDTICADIDAGVPVPKAEAERVVRGVGKHCRGPRAGTLPRLQLLRKLGFRLETKDGRVTTIESPSHLTVEDAALAVLLEHPTPEGPDPFGQPADIPRILRELFDLEERRLAGAVDQAARTRPCGYDVNETILAAPLDGQYHDAKCPRCGTDIGYTAPRIALTPEE